MVGGPRFWTGLAQWRRWLWALVAAALIPAAGLYGFVLGERREAAQTALPILGTPPAYTMTNQLGQQVSSASFRGKVQLVTFLFPYCTTMCPLIAAHLANLEHLGLRPAGIEKDVQIVSFNLDPIHTGPAQMREFLAQYGWNPTDLHWEYLAASDSEMHRVVGKGFGIGYQRVSVAEEGRSAAENLPVVQPEVANKLAERAHADYDIIHDDALEIVDQKGRTRKIYDNADTVDWRELLGVVEVLLQPPA